MGWERSYDWQRWWVPEPRDEGRDLQVDALSFLPGDGFLPDPESWLGRSLQRDLHTLATRQDVPVLILVGEAGSGKSREVQLANKRLLGADKRSQIVDLRTVTENELASATVGDLELGRCLESEAGATLWLDSLDEAPSDLSRAVGALARAVDGLSEQQRQRLRLRLVCRSTVWPQLEDLERELGKRWPGGNLQRLRLLPITQRDAAEAARAEGVDPQRFIQEIEERSLVALAARPLTLQLLLDAFKGGQGHLSARRAELFEQSCFRLCDEKQREPRPPHRERSAAERLAIATKIAAVSVLAGKEGVALGRLPGGVSTRIETAALEGTRFKARPGAEELVLREKDLRECLEVSGLFHGAGALDSYSFVHRTFAEFLAARALADQTLPLASVQQLLGLPDGLAHMIPPPLQGVATWLVELRSDVFEWLLDAQPELLMEAEGGGVAPELRPRLVDRLMERYAKGDLLPWHGPGQRWPRGLCHPGLAGQLRPWLRHRTNLDPEAHAAIRMAEACQAMDLVDDLLALAFDAGSSVHLRYRAVHAVGRLGSVEQRAMLRPLMDLDPQQDPDEDIRGAALAVLFPEQLAVAELLPRLTPRRRPHYLGSYWWFLQAGVVPRLVAGDLPTVLRWLEDRADAPGVDIALEELEAALLERAWLERADDAVITLLGKVVLARETHYKRTAPCLAPQGWPVEQDVDRRRLVETMIRYAAGLPGTTERAVWHLSDYLQGERDLQWALEELDGAASLHEARLWAEVALFTFPGNPTAQSVGAVLEATARHAVLKEVMRSRLDPVELESEEANRLRALQRNAPAPRPSLSERLGELVPSSDDEPQRWSDAWVRIVFDDLPGALRGRAPELDELPLGIVDSVARAALALIIHQDPGVDWLGKGSIPGVALAGQEALLWLWRFAPESFALLDGALLQKWIPTLLFGISTPQEGSLATLLQEARSRLAPEALHEALELVIQRGGLRDSVTRSRLMPNLWDDWLVDRLRLEVESPALSTEALEVLITMLLLKAPGAVEELVGQWLDGHRDRPKRARIAARAWLAARPVEAWPHVHAVMCAYPDLGRSLAEDLADWSKGRPGRQLLTRLGELELGELLAWLWEHFPPEDDPREPPDEGAPGVAKSGHPPLRLQVAWWRGEVLGELKQRGSSASVAAIEGLLASHPDQPWLKITAQEARERHRERVWRPASTEGVVKILEDPSHRLLRSDAELQGLVMEALSVLQGLVRDDPTQASHFWEAWTERPVTRRKPKDENSCSDELRVALGNLIAPSGVLRPLREVEIRPRRGPASAQRLDLLVQAAVSPHAVSEEALEVVIEVKGCWNPGVNSDMKEQLLGRYLEGGRANHACGIYLVCWFDQSSWDRDDPRRSAALRTFATAGEARDRLTEEARVLSAATGTHLQAFVLDLSLDVGPLIQGR